MLLIKDRKYFCEWANGLTFSSNTGDFATHLKGSVGERLKAVYRVKATLMTIASQQNQINLLNPGNVLERITGSWIEDGYQAGQTLYMVDDWTGSNATAASINSDFGLSGNVITIVTEKYMYFTTAVGLGTRGEKRDHAFIVSDKFTGLFFRYGLVENQSDVDFKSPFSDDFQEFYFGSIDTTTPTEHTMIQGGGSNASYSWLSGGATVQYIASTDDYSIGLNCVHEYEITLTFVITPTFIERYIDAYDDGLKPEEYSGGASLKMVTGYEFRTKLTNPNTSVIGVDNYMLGAVAWLNENYNGFNNIYSITNVVYTDVITSSAVDGLQSGRKTKVVGNIIGTGFTNTSKSIAYFWYAASQEQYESVQDSFQDTFLWDSIIGTMSSGTIEVTGSDRIKRFELNYIGATRIDFEMDIELSDSEKTLVETSLNNYLIGIQVGNTNSTDTSNKVILQIDWSPFVVSSDVPDLVRFENERIYPHNYLVAAHGFTDYKGWKQDGIVLKFDFYLNKFINAKLKNLRVKILAYNTSTLESFDVSSYQFPLTDIQEANDIQFVDVETSRNFKLGTNDQFNDVDLASFDPVGNEQKWSAQVGIKIDWQEWVRLTGASLDFYDSALVQKGLQTDASRFISGNWTVRFAIEVDAKQLTEDFTTYRHMSPSLEVYDWDLEDDNPEEWSVVIETFDLDDNNLSGAILKNQDTKVIATWTPLSGSTSDFTTPFAIHRIEKLNAVGQNEIDELSTIWTPRLGNIFKPAAGETLLKLTDFGTYIETECLIDYTRLQNNDYNISARLGRKRSGARYNIARDIKYISENEIIYMNCPDNGVAVSNSLRLAQLDINGFIESEISIALSALYTYQNFKIVVSDIVSNGKVNFYAVTYTGSATEVHEFIYDGATYQQTRIYTANLGGGTYTCIRIDPVVGQVNSKPYFWIGNSQANIGGQRGFKHLYYDGANWTTLDWICYDSGTPANDQCRYPIDVIFYGGLIYVLNFDLPPQSNQWEQGKIAVYEQTSGTPTTPSDRADFSNWTNNYNVYRNSGDAENIDGLGSASDLMGAVGFEIIEVDDNSLPIFIVTHDSSLGTDGARHFSRVYANIASPATSADWNIQTPMSSTNGIYGTPHNYTGQANDTIAYNKLQRKNQCHLLIISTTEFITGHQSSYYWTKHKINDWTGDNFNEWSVYSPNDPAFDFTIGNTLIE